MSGRIGFVILHYNAIRETIDCVNSIMKNIDTDNYFIIIVDILYIFFSSLSNLLYN